MSCTSPIQGYYSNARTENGKKTLVFNPKKAQGYDKTLTVPCGQCMGCKLERSRQWAVRMQHESKTHKENCFITLTYDNAHLPDDFSLNLKHFQDFMKRLRKKYEHKIRFYHCGEYGEENRRPHYHACLFGHDFPDKTHYKNSKSGHPLYISDQLAKLWPYGSSDIGNLTFDSAAYVARYCTKKITGEKADAHYSITHPLTGEIVTQIPEYATMSRRPGIGQSWFQQYKDETYATDYVVINGKKIKPPKYYDQKFKEEYPEEFLKIQKQRKDSYENSNDAKLDPADRLYAINKCTVFRANQNSRNL